MEEIDEKEWDNLTTDARNFNSNKRGIDFTFGTILKLFALINVLVCSFLGITVGRDLGWIYFVSGVASAIFWWAMSIIVEACDKYLKSK